MKLILENIGKIKKAEIDLDHQLTVFFGPNNTGKTYVSYCLYGLSRIAPFGDSVNSFVDLIAIDFEGLYKNGTIDVDLKDFFLSNKEILKENFIKDFKNILPILFGNYEIDFSKSLVFPSFFDNESEFKEIIAKNPFVSGGQRFRNGKYFTFYNNQSERIITIALEPDFRIQFDDGEKSSVEKNIKRQLVQFLFNFISIDAYFIPSERIGISVFGKDLVYNRFSKSNLPEKGREFFPYSKIIDDAIREQETLVNVSGRKNDDSFFPISREVESSILFGNLSINKAGDILYGYNDEDVLPIRDSASNIKSLSSLVFYLRYLARSGQSLFIDEPEINLHPDNQRKIAKILAKISNLGIKVYVSTHSDYIIREFNNLIMLAKDAPKKERLMKEYGYKQDEVLNHNSVGAYAFNLEGYPKQVEVTETGFAPETIDETINNQNKASNDIMFTLFES